jgi:histone H3/H4
VRKYQRATTPIIPFSAFNRVVREIATSEDVASILTGVRFTRNALVALQCGAEELVTNILEEANKVAVTIGHRSTILPLDFKYAVDRHNAVATGC